MLRKLQPGIHFALMFDPHLLSQLFLIIELSVGLYLLLFPVKVLGMTEKKSLHSEWSYNPNYIPESSKETLLVMCPFTKGVTNQSFNMLYLV